MKTNFSALTSNKKTFTMKGLSLSFSKIKELKGIQSLLSAFSLTTVHILSMR